MRITFICGSLEEGRDGVGDYVRNLAAELKKQGHQVAVVAIYERHLNEKIVGSQHFNNVDLEVLRIPSKWSVKHRFSEAKKFTDSFSPDYFSLQYVPFSFSENGLSAGLGGHLNKLSIGKPWHIMFHELWIGMDQAAPLKHVIWGMVQKQLVKSLIVQLNPTLIHTQSYLYQSQLARLGFKSNYLPLFSNIPRVFISDRNLGLNSEKLKMIKLVIFGCIHPNAPIECMAMEASGYSQSNGIQICLTFLGICGAEQERWVKVWEGNGLVAEVAGEQPPEVISHILGEANIGISTTPVALFDKSGSVAAMLEHGLPVMTVSRAWQPKFVSGLNLPCSLMEYRKGNFAELIDKKSTLPKPQKVSDVARTLADEMLAN